MDAFRLRKSNISALTDDRSSGNRLREGNRQVQKQSSFPKLTSFSSSQNSDTTGDHLVTRELGRRSSKQATGTPIKKLLAEEMSRETESKKRSPSVIARLMGFEGLPPHQLSHKQQKRSSENHLQRLASTEKFQSGIPCSHRSSRRSSKEEQEFKDVFEVSDTSKMETGSYALQGATISKLTEAEMAFVKQKFLDITCLSTDEKLHDSKEFNDAIEDLYSNKDLLLKFLGQPDSFFTKHLHDLQGALPPSRCGRASGMKSLHAPEHEGSGPGGKIERETLWKNHRKNHIDPLGRSYSKHAAEISHKSSKIQVEGKVESAVLPTRIVLLKPNLGKVQNAIRTVSSPHSSHDCKRHTELPSIKDREVELCGKKNFPKEAALSRYKSRESREIAKEITRQMRNSLESGSMILTSGFRGYAGDESSSNRSDNESANESDIPALIFGNSIGWSNRYRPSSSRSAESSVSREARKRLSERWKMTHRSEDMGLIGRGSTLGEMLAMPDREGRPANVDAMAGEKGLSDKFFGDDRPAGWVEPLGISSRDGWKDGSIRNFSRSRSVPASFTTVGSPRTDMHKETLCNERYLLPKEVTQRKRIKLVKGNFNQREGSSFRNSRPRTKRSHFSVHSYTDYSDISPEIQFTCNHVQNNITEDDPFEQYHTVSDTSAVVTDTSLVPENVVDVKIEMPSKPTDPESPAYVLAKGSCSSGDTEVLSSQEPSIRSPVKGSATVQHSTAELESLGSSKEAEQPSPVSVLETSFPDDLSSSSECFERLNADLHGLRMQLQLLKLESESYVEGPMLSSSDEDNELCEEIGREEDSREYSYVADVLIESGITDADQDSFMASCHSSECPVNPQIFEEVEKKHVSNNCWGRCERKLLFDRINSSLLVIKQQFADPHPWVKPASGIVGRWSRKGLEEGIHKLLENQGKNANKDALETDSQWLDLKDDIDVVGREIEKLLIEELVTEIIAL